MRDGAERLCTALGQTLRTGRNMAMDLRPPVIDDLGLGSALESLVKRYRERTGIDCDWEDESDFLAVPTNVSVAIYRIAQEALTNIRKHAQSKAFQLRLQYETDQVILTIADAGCGFKEDEKSSGLGLVGIRERVHLLKGKMNLQSTPDSGTRIEVQVPYNR